MCSSQVRTWGCGFPLGLPFAQVCSGLSPLRERAGGGAAVAGSQVSARSQTMKVYCGNADTTVPEARRRGD